MGRRPTYTDTEARRVFKGAITRYKRVPTSREFAKFARISVRNAWMLMRRLNMRKPCGSCKGTGWAQS